MYLDFRSNYAVSLWLTTSKKRSTFGCTMGEGGDPVLICFTHIEIRRYIDGWTCLFSIMTSKKNTLIQQWFLCWRRWLQSWRLIFWHVPRVWSLKLADQGKVPIRLCGVFEPHLLSLHLIRFGERGLLLRHHCCTFSLCVHLRGSRVALYHGSRCRVFLIAFTY